MLTKDKQIVIRLSCPANLAFNLALETLEAVGVKIKSSDPAGATIGGQKRYGFEQQTVWVQIQPGGASAPTESLLTLYWAWPSSKVGGAGILDRLMSEFEQELGTRLSAASQSKEIAKNTWRPKI